MPSTAKCPFCGGTVLSNEKTCPHCGGENPHFVEDSPRRIFQPKTIEELQQYCAERGMPLRRMRFFVGENFQEPKAFGIYKAGDNRYVVYKNKADGSRAVRYDGPDEAFAVKELFDKLLSECHNRGIYPDGVVQRTSGNSSSSGKNSSTKSSKFSGLQRPDVWVPLAIFCFLLCMALLTSAANWLQNRKEINAKIESFRRNPDTYDSVQIGNKYYTYDLNSKKLITSSSENHHLNDGYYLSDWSLYLYKNNEYRKQTSSGSKNGTVQEGTVYYRNGTDNWYAFIPAEDDWKPVNEPAYSLLNKELNYQGLSWNGTWAVPDFSSFPVESGYYADAENIYYRDSREYMCSWYVYQADSMDWVESACPVKLGVQANSLKNPSKMNEPGFREFEKSSPYAIGRQLSGYYRQENTFYYQYALPKNPNYWWRKDYIHYWCKYGRKAEASVTSDQEQPDEEWYQLTGTPDTASLTYLGSNYEPSWQKEWSVSDFKQSAVGMQVYSINGYVRQENNLYYHYKSSWYRFDSDSSVWESSHGPSDDGLAEVFLGDSYQEAGTDGWNEDWHTTDFKTSSAWQSIVRAEEAEAAKTIKEAAEKQAESDRSNRWSSSDYDNWDIGDTDWDSDW